MSKELKAERKAGVSYFLGTVTAKVAGSTSIAAFSGNSTAMRAGIEGVVKSIDYEEVGGANTPLLTADQVITVDGDQIILAKAGEKPQAPTIVLDNGITMTLGLLLQGGAKSGITFAGDAAMTPSINITVEQLASLVGKKLKCVDFHRDASNMIIRQNVGQPDRSYPANVYTFVQS